MRSCTKILSFALVSYTLGWKMLLWLQRAWSRDLPVGIQMGVKNADVNNTHAKLIVSSQRGGARSQRAFTSPLVCQNPIRASSVWETICLFMCLGNNVYRFIYLFMCLSSEITLGWKQCTSTSPPAKISAMRRCPRNYACSCRRRAINHRWVRTRSIGIRSPDMYAKLRSTQL